MEGYWKDTHVTFELSDLSSSAFATLGLADCNDVIGLGSNSGLRECILLIDGLGKNAIDGFASRYSNLSSLEYHLTLGATFPSTTATSLTSLGTGKCAGEHGMVGYTMRVPHSGQPERILNALKWDDRVDPQVWQPHETLFERGSRKGINVTSISGKRYEKTGFTQAALRGGTYRGANTIDEILSETITALKNERSFAYVYLNDVDEASHHEGFGSEKFLTALTKVDLLIDRLVHSLPQGTRLWVTADHGMVNRGSYVVIGKGNNLLDGVDLMAGEPRARYLYVAPERVDEVKSRWQELLGNQVTIYTRAEAIAAGLFGIKVDDRVMERIGDLIVIANEDFILVEMEREELQIAMVGHHGGLTPAEREIPLLLASI